MSSREGFFSSFGDEPSPLDEKDDVDSLPSDSTSELYSEADSDAEAEWERSLEQLQLILTMVLVPWMGKYFGRKFAYWSKCRLSIETI